MAEDDNPAGDGPDGISGAEDADIGAEAAQDVDVLLTLLGHFYRGQLDRETTWRTRLDRTTNWAVLVIATLLTWTFTARDNPHYILLIGALLVVLFLGVEAHRYRAYDVPRSRVRMLEEDLFAQLFDPDEGVERTDWRYLMSEDLREPAAKVSLRVAVARRLRRVYLPLVSILLAAWVVKITVFQPGIDPIGAAALPPIPGSVVVAVVVAFYAFLVILAAWPGVERGHREVTDEDPGAWQRDDR